MTWLRRLSNRLSNRRTKVCLNFVKITKDTQNGLNKHKYLPRCQRVQEKGSTLSDCFKIIIFLCGPNQSNEYKCSNYFSNKNTYIQFSPTFVPSNVCPVEPLPGGLGHGKTTINTESLVKGDVLHSDGLRVFLFSTAESLSILLRARTVLCDGTFRITPYLWYQTFVVSAKFRENSFILNAFGLLPDKKR